MPRSSPEPYYQTEAVTVYCGDSLQLLAELPRSAFTFCDPPFNIGQAYAEYTDRIDPVAYRRWVGHWMVECWDNLQPNGVLALHGPDSLAEIYLAEAARNEWTRIAWVNWHYRFGQCTRSNWIDARCHCLIYAKGRGYTWNPESVLVDSDRVAYGDRRIHETERGGKRLPGTVWGVPSDGPYWGRVQGNSTERRPNHPNQLPEVYLARLIRAYTNPRDLVVDPFAGSGTTAVVAAALGRECITIDVSKANCESVRRRLKKGALRIG